MSINFISSKDDFDETRNMRTKSDNIEIMTGNETDEITEELLKSLLQKYQEGLEELMKESEFIFDSVDLLYYHLQKASIKRIRSSYIDSPKWLKNKKATINPNNNDNNCFQYALTVALNYQNIKKTPQRISNIKTFVDQYDWKEIKFHCTEKTGKSLNQITSQLLLIFYLCYTILKKYHVHAYQNIILIVKIK